MIFKVSIAKLAERQLRKVPQHIKDNLIIWVTAVEHGGLEEVRKARGYHDEPLKGRRAGATVHPSQRQLQGHLRFKKDTVEFVSVEEVSKHDY